MEPDSLLRKPPPPPEAGRRAGFDVTLRSALEQVAHDAPDDAQAIGTVCAAVQPLLSAYGSPVPVEQWRDVHGLAVRRYLETGEAQERGLLIVDGMAHILSQPRAVREEQRWQLDAEARRHQVWLGRDLGLLLLAWRPAAMFRRGRLALDRWQAAVRAIAPPDLLANDPVEAFLHGLQDALTGRVERSRQWSDFIRHLNQEFDRLLG